MTTTPGLHRCRGSGLITDRVGWPRTRVIFSSRDDEDLACSVVTGVSPERLSRPAATVGAPNAPVARLQRFESRPTTSTPWLRRSHKGPPPPVLEDAPGRFEPRPTSKQHYGSATKNRIRATPDGCRRVSFGSRRTGSKPLMRAICMAYTSPVRKTTIYLDAADDAMLTEAAARRGVSRTELIREAIRRMLGTDAEPVRRPRPLGRSGRSDTSGRVDELLDEGFGD